MSLDVGDDSLARVSQVYDWQKYGGIPGWLNWPGGHHYLIYLVSKVCNVPFEEGGRLLSLISSILIIPFAFKLFSFLFNKTTAYFSLFLYALNPYFIKFSTIQMTEIPFLFFMVVGIYYGFKFFKNSKNSYFLLSILPLNIASLMRFEAWIIIPLLSIIFLMRYGNCKKVFTWSIFAIFSALLFSLYSFFESGNPISGVTASDVEVLETLKDKSILYSLKSFISTPWLPIYLLPILTISIIHSLQRGKNKYFILAISLLSFFYLFKMCTQSLMPFWRYLTFVLMFLIPITFYFLSQKFSITSLVVLLFIFYIPHSIIDLNSIYAIQKPVKNGFLESSSYVRNNLLKMGNKFILSINPGGDNAFWLIKSGIYNDYETFHRLHPGSDVNYLDEKFTSENIAKNIMERNYNVVLIESNFEIDSAFQISKLKNYLLEKKIDTFVFEDYILLEIKEP